MKKEKLNALKNLNIVGLAKEDQTQFIGATAIEYGIFITMISIGGACL